MPRNGNGDDRDKPTDGGSDSKTKTK